MRASLVLLLLWPAFLGAQHLTYAEWQWKAAHDMRLMPRFDGREKNAEQLASDSAFMAQTLAMEPDRENASEHLAGLGFGLLREGNLTHAMYRFNQAYMLSPWNPEVYRGYGGFFMALDRSTEAGKQYAEGLVIDSTYVPLMNDFAAAFLAEYHINEDKDPKAAEQLLTGAIRLLERALRYDPKNAEAAFKLSVCHLAKNDCAKAWEYRDRCKAYGGGQLTPEFEAQLKGKCPH